MKARDFYAGIPLDEAAKMLGMTRSAASNHLYRHGLRHVDGILQPTPTVQEREDSFAALRRPTPVPCWRCGARECGHRRAA